MQNWKNKSEKTVTIAIVVIIATYVILALIFFL